MFASWGIGLLSLHQGDLRRALPLLERAVGLCHEADSPALFPWMVAAWGEAYTLSGRVADAVPLLTQALEQTMATDMVGFQALCSLSLGETQMLAGHPEEAYTLAERVLAHARAHKERGNEAYALRLLGDIAAHRAPPTPSKPKPTTGRPSHWPRSWGCVRSWPTATAASACSISS
jgi:tetratricopeptide (TPR) repeat protein